MKMPVHTSRETSRVCHNKSDSLLSWTDTETCSDHWVSGLGKTTRRHLLTGGKKSANVQLWCERTSLGVLEVLIWKDQRLDKHGLTLPETVHSACCCTVDLHCVKRSCKFLWQFAFWSWSQRVIPFISCWQPLSSTVHLFALFSYYIWNGLSRFFYEHNWLHALFIIALPFQSGWILIL